MSVISDVVLVKSNLTAASGASMYNPVVPDSMVRFDVSQTAAMPGFLLYDEGLGRSIFSRIMGFPSS